MALSCPYCKQDLDVFEDSKDKVKLKYRRTRELLMAILIFLGWGYSTSRLTSAMSTNMTVGDIIIVFLYIPLMAVTAILDTCFRFILGDYWIIIINSRLGIVLLLIFAFILSYLIAKIFYNYSHEDNYLTFKYRVNKE